jgi:hypothetical protein
MVHNRPVRHLVAACLLVLFAALATADTFVCPDGCQMAASGAAADQCNASGKCAFCTGSIVTYALQVVTAPVTRPSPAQELPQQVPPLQPALALDHPPRLT